MTTVDRPTIYMEIDSGADVGIGHAIRSLTLARRLAELGWNVNLARELDVPAWAAPLLTGIDRATPVPPGGQAPDVYLVDSYRMDPRRLQEMRSRGAYVVALVDGAMLDYEADLYIDQNFGATPLSGAPSSATWLLGPQYAIVRESVTALRQPEAPEHQQVRPRILAFFGGTDAADVAPYAVGRLAALPDAFSLAIVTSSRQAHQAVDEATSRGRRELKALTPRAHLEPLMASADIVICAAGTSVWDLMTLGKTIVTTTVMPNQIPIIERLEDDGLVLSLGDAHHWTTPAMDSLMTLISQQKTRVGMARRCWDTVDGHGAQRIARYLDGRERNA